MVEPQNKSPKMVDVSTFQGSPYQVEAIDPISRLEAGDCCCSVASRSVVGCEFDKSCGLENKVLCKGCKAS